MYFSFCLSFFPSSQLLLFLPLIKNEVEEMKKLTISLLAALFQIEPPPRIPLIQVILTNTQLAAHNTHGNIFASLPRD